MNDKGRATTVKLIDQLPEIPEGRPILLAGPTASGKSALAMEIAERFGGVIVNADASQVYDCWRVISARPSDEDERRVPHRLYGYISCQTSYSTGHWLRDARATLAGAERPIIVGGTGLYFSALTEGMADIPETPPEIRAEADTLSMETLLAGIDPVTATGLDLMNRARVQRAWEVQRATGRTLHAWQAETPPPTLELRDCVPLVLGVDKLWLWDRIARRFNQMLNEGALDEVTAIMDHYTPALPAFKAIGVPELVAHLRGELSLDAAREKATIATRRYAKRQRTWFRARMRAWNHLTVPV
ncbi:tRNA (adenosine(37)-N6)-dimethylallyltransferase MiaA [Ruegeria aquimaris]|uniref:tRNA dimethylallyltransferase n=1 Tax=Ruegeria aquimaris TaxID=2984333 RepID=A0ABT3ADL1_9RHOB|nr:tRNA (adenosine(37)-N6)-dimethylallyltransferase MiaA [Ruegeria sp. XHP0148]MCV2886730.1 tRNA (adenosine(37)-N6)-dimethylallyltransferase MiaA [Ruegeria sp. XHP0148]